MIIPALFTSTRNPAGEGGREGRREGGKEGGRERARLQIRRGRELTACIRRSKGKDAIEERKARRRQEGEEEFTSGVRDNTDAQKPARTQVSSTSVCDIHAYSGGAVFFFS